MSDPERVDGKKGIGVQGWQSDFQKEGDPGGGGGGGERGGCGLQLGHFRQGPPVTLAPHSSSLLLLLTFQSGTASPSKGTSFHSKFKRDSSPHLVTPHPPPGRHQRILWWKAIPSENKHEATRARRYS